MSQLLRLTNHFISSINLLIHLNLQKGVRVKKKKVKSLISKQIVKILGHF